MSVPEPLPGLLRLPAVDGPIWGIDPSTKRIALARLERTWIDEDPTALRWSTISLSQRDGLHRLGNAAETIEAWLPDAYTLSEMEGGPPAAVYVEQPFASRPELVHPQSYFMCGVVIAAVGRAYPKAQIETLTPPQWKKTALGAGRGHAEKPAVMAWACSMGYTGSLQDEADAVGIAVAGATMRLAIPRAA